MLLASKYIRLVISSRFIMNNRVVWSMMEGIEGGILGISRIYASNIPSHRSLIWQEMAKSLPKYYSWILGRDFNMIELPEDKSQDCGRTISDLERSSWNFLLDALQLYDSFQHRGRPQFMWDNQLQGLECHFAQLDRIYTPKNKGGRLHPLNLCNPQGFFGSD